MYNGGKMDKNKICVIFILVIILIIAINEYSLAKYKSENNAIGMVKIAKPVLIIERGNEVKIDTINRSGIYLFSIKNYNDVMVNEIDMKYYLEIIGYDNEDINIDIFKNEEKIEFVNFTTPEYIIPHNVKVEDKFKLDINYNKTNFTRQVNQNIEIILHSEQI